MSLRFRSGRGRRPSPVRVLAVLLTPALLALSACGTRLPEQEIRRALAAGPADVGASGPRGGGADLSLSGGSPDGRSQRRGGGRSGSEPLHENEAGTDSDGSGDADSSTTRGGDPSGGGNDSADDGSDPTRSGDGGDEGNAKEDPRKDGDGDGDRDDRSDHDEGDGDERSDGEDDGEDDGDSGGHGTRDPCEAGGGSTDIGVTATSIEVGGSYGESSLVPGMFRPAMDAIQAYLGMVNRSGGVCGREIRFHFHNDGINAPAYAENVRHLTEDDRVFALLGSLSAADSGGCSYMAAQRPPDGVPDIGSFGLSYCRAQAPNFYSPVGSLKPGIYGCCAEWDWLKERFGYQKPAVHYLDIEISRDQGLAVVDSLVRQLGLSSRDDISHAEHSPAQFDYTSDVLRMRDEGVDAVWSSMDLNNNVKLLRAMCQQQWYPNVVHLEVSAYDPSLIERVGGECMDAQNVWVRSVHLPFNEKGNSEISLYVRTLQQFCPDCSPTTFGLEGWLSAKLFVGALREVGSDLTRAALFRALDGVRDWTGGGVMGPVTPSERLIYHCNYMLDVRSDGFFRESPLLCGKFYASGTYDGPPVGP